MAERKVGALMHQTPSGAVDEMHPSLVRERRSGRGARGAARVSAADAGSSVSLQRERCDSASFALAWVLRRLGRYMPVR